MTGLDPMFELVNVDRVIPALVTEGVDEDDVDMQQAWSHSFLRNTVKRVRPGNNLVNKN